jgi:hypothetical protein
MTETNTSLYWIGALIAGLFISGLSAGGMWLLENKKPTPKTVGRDFILGGILFFILLQLVPESTMTLLTGILAIVPVMKGGDNSTPSVVENILETLTGAVAPIDEVEVRVGVPRF